MLMLVHCAELQSIGADGQTADAAAAAADVGVEFYSDACDA